MFFYSVNNMTARGSVRLQNFVALNSLKCVYLDGTLFKAFFDILIYFWVVAPSPKIVFNIFNKRRNLLSLLRRIGGPNFYVKNHKITKPNHTFFRTERKKRVNLKSVEKLFGKATIRFDIGYPTRRTDPLQSVVAYF